MRKSFNEKLNDPKQKAEIIDLSDKPEYVLKYNAKTMLIATPIEYNEIMRNIPKGKIITSDKVREFLAKKHNADTTCPLTAGIFMNICANAASERNETTFPYWRTVKAKGELNEKYPGGIEKHKQLLNDDGIETITKGKKVFVKDFESKLYKIK